MVLYLKDFQSEKAHMCKVQVRIKNWFMLSVRIYNMATTYLALKPVLFVINYKVLTMHGEEKQRSLVS